jgi:hypothetical protein
MLLITLEIRSDLVLLVILFTRVDHHLLLIRLLHLAIDPLTNRHDVLKRVLGIAFIDYNLIIILLLAVNCENTIESRLRLLELKNLLIR